MRHFGIKIQKISGEGAQPPHQTPPHWGGGHPLPKPHPPRRLRRLDLAPPRSPTLDPPLHVLCMQSGILFKQLRLFVRHIVVLYLYAYIVKLFHPLVET